MSQPVPVQKVLFWFLAAAMATFLAVAMLFVAVNWHDRPPTPAALRLAQITRALPAVAPERNGFVYLLGIDGAPALDPRTLGAGRFAWLQQQAATPGPVPRAFPDGIAPHVPERAPAFLALYASCRQIDGNCAEALEADPVQALAWVNSEQWILERYLALLAHSAWSEARPFDPELPLAPYNWALDAQRLFFVHAWINAGKGDVEAVATLLGQDMAFWRMVLASSDNFTARRAATVALNRHLMWASLVMRTLPPEQRMAAIPAPWRAELTAAERSVLRNVATEYNTVRRNVELIKRAHRARLWAPLAPLTDRVFQVQHTLNPHADRMVAVADVYSGPYAQLGQAGKQIGAVYSDAEHAIDSWLYNLAGRSVPGPRLPEVAFYASRSADLEGLRRAALLTAELRSEDIDLAAMQQRLNEAALRNPITGQPFTWDEKAQAVRFSGISAAPYGEYVIFY